MVPQSSDQPIAWRVLLGRLIADREERLRIAEVSGLRALTLQRWVQGESDPRPDTLQALLTAVPVHRQKLLDLIQEEFPDFVYVSRDDDAPPGPALWSRPTKNIPSAFFEHVLYAYATTSPSLLFWSICKLVLQQALFQLDPERLGMVISVARCLPSAPGGKVRCLWEPFELGTPPWRGDLADKTAFLGAESLAGYAIASCSPAIVQRLSENPDGLPVRPAEHSKSAASYPLLRAGFIAGCLNVASIEQDFFTATRIALVESYSRLLLLAFNSEEFFPRGLIELGILPPDDVQQTRLSTFRTSVNALLLGAAEREEAMTIVQAEQAVRLSIVEELLQVRP
jgi:transcriptional regulator with XRE-family HTH domain